MERFNLDTWLQDKSRKVIDDDGFPVEIIKWDANEKCPVVYLNHDGIAYNVSVDGMYDSDPNHGLFFADNEPYNPYKATVESIAEMVEKYEPFDSNLQDFYDNVKVKCKDAMEYDKLFPQEEFIPKKQYDEDLDKAYKNADKVQFNRGMSEILNNPQKYFHVGDTIRLKNSNAAEHTITSIFNGRYYGEGWSLDIMKASDDYELVEDCDEIIDYNSEIIGFLKNYINEYGCTAMNNWVNWLEKQGEQKPTDHPLANEKMEIERWKEACKAACSDRNYRSYYGLTETIDDYFVDGVQWADENPKQKPWNEEDEKRVNSIISSIEYCSEQYPDRKEYAKDINWLKSLKDRVILQPKKEWSEEDEKMISFLIKIFEVNHPNGRFKVNPIGTTNMEAISTKEIVDWLKSLKIQKKRKMF